MLPVFIRCRKFGVFFGQFPNQADLFCHIHEICPPFLCLRFCLFDKKGAFEYKLYVKGPYAEHSMRQSNALRPAGFILVRAKGLEPLPRETGS